MMEIFTSEKALWAGITLMGTVGWFAVRMFFVTRKDHETQRLLDQQEGEQERAKLVQASQKLAETVDKLSSRVVALETRVNALPTEAMLHNLNLSITALAATQQGQQVQLESIGRNLTLIHEHLLEVKRG